MIALFTRAWISKGLKFRGTPGIFKGLCLKFLDFAWFSLNPNAFNVLRGLRSSTLNALHFFTEHLKSLGFRDLRTPIHRFDEI